MENENKLYSWINSSLKISCYPTLTDFSKIGMYGQYDVVINVSDEFHFDYSSAVRGTGKDYYWFPMGEMSSDMGMSSLFGSLVVLYKAFNGGKKVILHCHAGSNRSPTVANAFIFMMTMEHRDVETWRSNGVRKYNRLIQNATIHLPDIEILEKWLLFCKETMDNEEKFIGGMYDWTLEKAGIYQPKTT